MHGHGSLLFPAFIYKILNHKTKLILTFHTQPQLGSNPKKGLIRYLWGKMLHKCNYVVALTDTHEKSLRKIYPLPDKIKIIPFGVNVLNITEDEINDFKLKLKLDLKQNFFILSTVGIFVWDWKVKGIEFLLETLRELINQNMNIVLLIAGDGPLRKRIENKIDSLKLKDFVYILGNVDKPAIPVTISDVYVHLALNEALPAAVLEAMKIGKAIIAANRGGLKDIIIDGENGILVEPENAKEVAEKIKLVLENDRIRKNLEIKAKQYAEQNYTWEKCADAYLSLYSEKDLV